VLKAILVLANEKGYSPTVREIQVALGHGGPSSIHAQLTVLRDMGYVTWVDGQPRTLVVTDEGREAL
jgi:repressor LexA